VPCGIDGLCTLVDCGLAKADLCEDLVDDLVDCRIKDTVDNRCSNLDSAVPVRSLCYERLEVVLLANLGDIDGSQ
jgi:hypothetical protein